MTGVKGILGASLAVFAFAFAGAMPVKAAPAQGEDAVVRLVDSFTRAQRDYDPSKLAALTTPNYVEVSPIGDVDTREEMLGFYAPDKKRVSPELVISDRLVKLQGDGAVLLAKLSFAAPGPGGTTRTVSMRASFIARRTGGEWRLAAAHYTPLRSQGL